MNELKILKFWRKRKIFEKSLQKKGKPFVFYDGPPFATGLPHYGHIIASAIKDVIPRYKTMRGFKVARRWGWDCHGLPIENLTEKELNLKTKKDIEKLGVDKFNKACCDSVLRYADEWKKFIPRMARWVDMENDYKTMDNRYIEVIWWIFKQLHSQNLIYEGYKSMHLCPRCETTLSNFEVTLGYREVKDISVYVKFSIFNFQFSNNDQFSISNDDKVYLLAWTTTPWTLPGTVALAVGLDIRYLILDIGEEGEFYIVAKDRVEEVMGDKEYKKVGELKGSDLVGLEWEPIFDFTAKEAKKDENFKNAFKVYGADFVLTKEGTSVVTIAPAFGEDDYQLSLKHQIPFLQHVNRDGTFKNYVKNLAGQKVREKDDEQRINVEIIKYLAAHKLLFAKEKYSHAYPHCWRCDTPLLNYSTSSWFVKVTKLKSRLLKANDKINWVPSHLQKGRFGKWLEGARDWAISRSRYWGAPLPVWRCENPKCKAIKVVGSIQELSANQKTPEQSSEAFSCLFSLAQDTKRDCQPNSSINGSKSFVKSQNVDKQNKKPVGGVEPPRQRLTNLALHRATGLNRLYQKQIDLHRPYIDKIILTCSKCDSQMSRVEEVFDCWFESGSMPYASEIMFSDYELGPETSRQDLLKQIPFPADFIAEGIDQTRGWFYTLLVLGVALYDKSPFKNVAVNGIILAEDGQKMSKRLKNYPDPNKIIDKYGADAMRFYLLSSPAVRGEALNFSEKGVDEVYKKVVLLSLNVLKFWKTYANNCQKLEIEKLGNWEIACPPNWQGRRGKLNNILDKWILVRLSQLTKEVTLSLDNYEIDKACRPIAEFINDLSTWYLRRSRDRFKDKSQISNLKSQNQNSKLKTAANLGCPVEILGYVLVQLSKLLAPICPFLAEYVYQEIGNHSFAEAAGDRLGNLEIEKLPESVHLEKWTQINSRFKIQNLKLLKNMQKVRDICEIGHSLRDEAGVKVRQVLGNFQFSIFNFQSISNDEFSIFKPLIKDELNVKEVEMVDKLSKGKGWVSKDGAALYTVIDDELKQEGIVRELTRQINFLRKKQGLTIKDKVKIKYQTDSKFLQKVIEKYQEDLKKAVLAEDIEYADNMTDGKELKVDAEKIFLKFLILNS